MKTDLPQHGAVGGLSRRRFMQLSAMAAGAAAAGPYVLRGAQSSGKPQKAEQLNVALVGCGLQGTGVTRNLLSIGVNLLALCDVDEKQIGKARKICGSAAEGAKAYGDYRKLLDSEKSLDAVVVATPDHWHAALCTAFIQAGKHVYCEKPLTRTIGEARALRTLASTSQVATQMGNQGSASQSMRRCVEIIRAGALGQVREVHVWVTGGTWPHGIERPAGEDPIPAGFDWDFWIGPSPLRPYKEEVYHPYNWRGWYDFGTGQIGNFACHALNLPMRALDLAYPEKVEVVSEPSNGETYARQNVMRLEFAARKALDPLTIHWYDGGPQPAPELVKDVTSLYKKRKDTGVLIVGEKGIVYTDLWNKGCLIKLKDDARLWDVLRHERTKNIPVTLPRVKNHGEEWVDACLGGPKTFSDFETAGRLTELSLAGLLALRLGRTIEWDGENMQVKGMLDAQRYITPPARKDWII